MSVEVDSDPPIWDMFVHFAKVEAFPVIHCGAVEKVKKKKEFVISSQHFNLSRSQLKIEIRTNRRSENVNKYFK